MFVVRVENRFNFYVLLWCYIDVCFCSPFISCANRCYMLECEMMLLVLSEHFRKTGAQLNSTETQKLCHTPRSVSQLKNTLPNERSKMRMV